MKKIILAIVLLFSTIGITLAQDEYPFYTPVVVYSEFTVTGDVYLKKGTSYADTMGVVVGKDGKLIIVPLVKKSSTLLTSPSPIVNNYYQTPRPVTPVNSVSLDTSKLLELQTNQLQFEKDFVESLTDYDKLNKKVSNKSTIDILQFILLGLLLIGFVFQWSKINKTIEKSKCRSNIK